MVDVKTKFVQSPWFSVGFFGQLFKIKVEAQFIQKLLGGQPVDSFKKSVVVHDCQVIGRVEKCHKIVEWLFTCADFSLLEVSFPALFPNVESGGSSVMTVADVKIGNFLKLFLEPV